GTLRVTQEKAGQLERSVKASNCEQVADALALVAALSVDPDASLNPREKPKPAGPSSATPPAPSGQKARAQSRAPADPSATKLVLGLTLTGRSGIAPQL